MKKKMAIALIALLVLAILLIPIRLPLKDGGSVVYKSLAYEVTVLHQLTPEPNGERPYIDGLEIKILGISVYREMNE